MLTFNNLLFVKAFITYVSLFVEYKTTQLYFQILYQTQHMRVFFLHILVLPILHHVCIYIYTYK